MDIFLKNWEEFIQAIITFTKYMYLHVPVFMAHPEFKFVIIHHPVYMVTNHV